MVRCPRARWGNYFRLAKLVRDEIAVAVPEIGEGLFERGVVVDFGLLP
jgi:hypothetical protein